MTGNRPVHFAGYKQVSAFSNDSDYESDGEETLYVTLDLGTVDPTLLPSSSKYRLIGLDTSTPYLQLAGTVFKGKHDELLGTELLFTDGPPNADEGDKARQHIVHVANTEHRIRFREVELKSRMQETLRDPEGVRNESVGLNFIEQNAAARQAVAASGRARTLSGSGRGRGAKGKGRMSASSPGDEKDDEVGNDPLNSGGLQDEMHEIDAEAGAGLGDAMDVVQG